MTTKPLAAMPLRSYMRSTTITSDITINPYMDVFQQQIDEAALYWSMRERALMQPHYAAQHLMDLEEKIDQTLDEIVSGVGYSWPVIMKSVTLEEPAETFVAAVTAFRSLEESKIKSVVGLGGKSQACFKGLVSAIAWLPGSVVEPWLKRFMASKDFAHKRLAVASYGARRESPGEALANLLEREDCRADAMLYARCLRLIGELKQGDLAEYLFVARASSQANVRFWAHWSLALLGFCREQAASSLSARANATMPSISAETGETLFLQEGSSLHADSIGLSYFEPLLFSDGPYRDRAFDIVFRLASPERSRALISQLARNSSDARPIVKATAILGDPNAIDWLIQQMEDAAYARIAGEAFLMITGIDLEANLLANRIPDLDSPWLKEDTESFFSEDDEDEFLPWPNVALIKGVWQKYRSKFDDGQRYFMGRPISRELLNSQWLGGYQRQRVMAAIELALLSRNDSYFNAKGRVPKLALRK